MQDVFKALSDETRRQILQALRTGPKTSGDLADLFHSSWPTISRHLAVLRQARLVVSERRGQEVVYELNTTVFEDLVQHLLGWLEPVSKRTKSTHKMPRRREA